MRALLAAAAYFGDSAYAEGAYRVLDRYVDEQHADGSWSAQYFGSAGCPRAAETAREGTSRNLADAGTMALCLAVAAPHADAQRRERYLASARRFADSLAVPNQLDSGAFPNLTYRGREYRHPYSVATGVQAASLAALYAATGEKRYLAPAEAAARFLAGTVEPFGAVRFHPHDAPRPVNLNPSKLGDLFYVIDGLLWVRRYGSDSTRVVLDEALGRYFRSSIGLASWPGAARWLTTGNTWERSKRAGFLYLLAEYGAATGDTTGASRIGEFARALEDTAFAPYVGVAAPPDTPLGDHGFAATGFAALSVAALLDPSVLWAGTPPGRRAE